MSRKTRTLVILLLVAGLFGWRYLRDHARPNAQAADAPAAATQQAAAPVRKLGRIAFRPCTLTAPAGAGAAGVEAQCGSLSVPENPARPQGRKIALNIAWLPAALDGPNEPDPVFMLAGGPGQSATETYPQVAPAFAEIRKHRSVILVDQRGTGGSNRLVCKDDGTDAVTPDNAADARAAAERCRDALQAKADLRFYTTTDAIRDLDAVRAAIGAAQVNLVGISYGTRVAQQYARRYPTHTRALVLDSVAPNTLFFGNDFARNLDDALDLQFGQCAQVPACAKALGDPRSRLDALLAKLRTDPPTVRYRDASTGEAKQDVLKPEAVAGLVRMFAYIPAAASVLPLQIKEAAEGRYETLMAMAQMLGGAMSDSMAMGMQLSVVCSEDAAGIRAGDGADGTLLGTQLTDFLGAQCAAWPKGAMPADFHQPLRSDVPALVLAGEFDPVTPPRYGKEVVATLPNARLFVLEGQGHNVIGAGCMPKLVAQFLDTRDAKALDGKCLDTLTATPPFTSFGGWEP
ncbi:MAG TPA: alpha/beta hydrolase [Xanthomonadaceae bacterium]|nr:alpha/beta hydrolase [Xanthomonadaceae bacterium]